MPKVYKILSITVVCFALVFAGLWLFEKNKREHTEARLKSLQSVVFAREVEIGAKTQLARVCLEREEEANKTLAEREKLLVSLKRNQKKEGLCEELTPESRAALLLRLNRPL